MQQVHFIFVAVLFAVISRSDVAFAQASLQIPLQFDFLNPGARSRAVAGSFAGLADDATAAVTNPAGLTIVAMPELSFEGVLSHIETPFLRGGRLSGDPSGSGVDTVAGPIYDDSMSNAGSIGFMSFVIPRGRYAIALYRQQLLKFEDSFETEGVFQSQGARELALQATREFNIVNYGVSTAVRFNNVFSLGVGLSLHRLTLESRFNRYTFSGPFSSASYASDLERARSLQNGGDTNAALNVGVLWSVHPQVRLGMVFRQGPDFDVTFVEGPLDEFVERQGSLSVPDRYSVGAAIRLTGELTVAAELTHVRYSSLQTFVDMQSALSGRSSQFSVHDGTEIHGGVEYVFAGASLQPAIRFGVWHDPDHSIEYEPTAARDRADERYSAYLANRGAELHVTGGMGLALNRRLELNVAADVSPRNRTVSASTVVRF